MNTNMRIMMHANSCNCAACTPVPTLGIKMPYEEEKKVAKTRKGRQKLVVGENDLATVVPKVAAMWSNKNAHTPSEFTAGSNKKAFFMCPDCNQEFEAVIRNVVRAVKNGYTGCYNCNTQRIKTRIKTRNVCHKPVVGENDLTTVAPKVAAMLSEKGKHLASEVIAGSNKKAIFMCPDCHQEFEATICHVVRSVGNGTTGCPVCAGHKIVSGINDIASQYPEVAAMLSEKDKHIAFEVGVGSTRKAVFVCPDCNQRFEAKICDVVRSVKNGTRGCPVCAGQKVVSGINDLASQHPEVAAMLSEKDKHIAFEVTAGSTKKVVFICPDCKQEFESPIRRIINSVNHGHTGCPVCVGKKVVSGINDLASQYPEVAAMLSEKDKHLAFEVTAGSREKAIFVCPDCNQEFEAVIQNVVRSVSKTNTTGCPVCAGKKVVPGINDLASQCPKVAAMWSGKNKLTASEVTVGSNKKAVFVCPDCGKEFKAIIRNVVCSVENDCTGCYDCGMKRINAISKPECFVVRLMLAFAGENGIANPFSDVRNILGENSLLGLDFVDHIQKLCGEYNGVAWHGDDEHVVRDRFKFEAAHKAGYTIIRIQEPGLEVLDPKYDIVMPEGFRDSGGRYNAEIMEEVGRKVIHLLEEIYGRKASPEIWALNNFKEFEAWYDANKKELEVNARKRGQKGKTAAKMAA